MELLIIILLIPIIFVICWIGSFSYSFYFSNKLNQAELAHLSDQDKAKLSTFKVLNLIMFFTGFVFYFVFFTWMSLIINPPSY